MADATLTFDASLWDWPNGQPQMTPAMAHQLLFAAGITHEGMSVVLTPTTICELVVKNPSVAPGPTLTQAAIEAAYATWKTAADAAAAAEATERAAVAAAVAGSGLDAKKLAEVETAIDNVLAAASNVAQLKAAIATVLKRFAAVMARQGAFRR